VEITIPHLLNELVVGILIMVFSAWAGSKKVEEEEKIEKKEEVKEEEEGHGKRFYSPVHDKGKKNGTGKLDSLFYLTKAYLNHDGINHGEKTDGEGSKKEGEGNRGKRRG